MNYRFRYLGRDISVYGLDVSRWFVTIDGSHLMRDEEKAQFNGLTIARACAYSFVRSLAEDELASDGD